MELFEQWGTRHAGLFTFAASARHVGLYQKFGFWPRYLTAIMSMPVTPPQAPTPSSRLSEFAADARTASLRRCGT
jgi:hypothetical protein